MNASEQHGKRCENCRKEIEGAPVLRTIVERDRGRVVSVERVFCSVRCGGQFQMSREG